MNIKSEQSPSTDRILDTIVALKEKSVTPTTEEGDGVDLLAIVKKLARSRERAKRSASLSR